MTQIATVEKKLGAGYVEISVPRTTVRSARAAA